MKAAVIIEMVQGMECCMRILIIDDDPFVLKLLSLQLKAFGLRRRGFLELVPCERGSEAVKLLESGHESIGLIFCDLQMPEMDGVEFVRHLARVGYRGGLVLVSGEDRRILQTAEQLAKAQSLNVLSALTKPVFPEQLRQVLDAALPQPAVCMEVDSPAVYTRDELQRAMASMELVNFYQPKVALASGAVVGMEALVRWRHPVDGLVMPMSFIPMTEELGLISEMTEIVLDNALRDGCRWREAGHHLHIAVNVSMRSLRSLEFPDCVARHAHELGFPLDELVLEITESRLMEDPASQLDVLTRLRLKHVGLSIDDFGTGYSCLAQLRDLPFAELKIDRGFVHGAAQNPVLRAILDVSLELARQLDMRTVAEGIEDLADWRYLRESGCELAQGFFISQPMPADQVEPWLADWSARHQEIFS